MEIAEMKPGELVYADATFKFTLKGKIHRKTMLKSIISRKYEGNWPILDDYMDSLIIGKLIDKKNRHEISNVEVIGLNILARTGFINKPYVKGTIHSTGTIIDKQTRLDNGTFV